MLPTTSTARSFWELVDSLSKAGFKDWSALQASLEARLRDGLSRGEMTLTRPERQLLDGLHLRERFLHIPFYAAKDAKGPSWWISLKGSCEKAEAMTPESRHLPPVPAADEDAPSPT